MGGFEGFGTITLCLLSRSYLEYCTFILNLIILKICDEIQGNSVTMKVSENLVQSMHEEAEKTWVPEFVRVIKEIKKPFLNVIYDCDPLEQIFWDKEVLIGDAAHPTTPHGLRSTNMSILDADVLGKCLEKWEVENLNSALKNISPLGCQLLRSRFYILGD